MKKFTALLLSCVIACAAWSCSGQEAESPAQTEATVQTAENTEPETAQKQERKTQLKPLKQQRRPQKASENRKHRERKYRDSFRRDSPSPADGFGGR